MVCGYLQNLGIPSAKIVPLFDCLSFGPVTDGPEGDRIEFWRSQYSVFPEDERPDEWSGDGEMLESRRDQLLSADRIVIWVGASLDEILAFFWVLAALSRIGIPLGRIATIRAGVEPRSERRVASLNMLPEAAFDEYLGTEKPITSEEAAAAAGAWEALVAHQPSKINVFCRGRRSAAVGVESVFCLIRQRYPLQQHGVPAYLLRLLRGLEGGAVISSRLLARYFKEYLHEADCPDSAILEASLLRLSAPHAKVPLVNVTPQARGFVVSLTDSGRSVLQGETNNIALNGIDEWVGGVHLCSSASEVWIYSDERNEIVEYAQPRQG